MCKRSNYTQNSPQYEGDCEYRITSVECVSEQRVTCWRMHWLPFIDATCFEDFLQREDMKFLLKNSIIYHIDAPGQVSSCSW